MTKAILLGMTAEEILKKLQDATPQEVFEFNKLIESMDNGEEIKEQLTVAAIAEVKKRIFKLIDDVKEEKEQADEEEKQFLNAFEGFATGLASIIDALEEEEEDEEDLVSFLRGQMTKSKQTLADQLKEQLETKKSLSDILREQLEPKKSLTDILREQMESDEASVTKEDILAEIIENILEIELESDEMVVSNESAGYKIVIGLMFAFNCAANNVQYELEEKDVEKILTSVVNGLIDNGRKLEIRIEEDEVFTVIR